jgi:hypothetical protein
MANYKKWTQSELEFIQNNQSTFSDQELAAKLTQICGQNVTMAMIRRQRRKLNIEKPKGRRPKNRTVTTNDTAPVASIVNN